MRLHRCEGIAEGEVMGKAAGRKRRKPVSKIEEPGGKPLYNPPSRSTQFPEYSDCP